MAARAAAEPSIRRHRRAVDWAKKSRKGLLGVDKTRSLMVDLLLSSKVYYKTVEGGIHKP